MAYESHQHSSKDISARCAVITLSDTRTEATDASGARIKQLLLGQRHGIVDYRIVPDEPATFEPVLKDLLARGDVDLILTTGGTGISRRDQTIPVVQRNLEQTLPGFGELFRRLSFEQIGTGAILSRALAGTANGKLVISIPGSTKAVELAMTRIILPELGHLIYELRR